MAADLYWDWLKVPREKRPPNHFDLLGLSADVSDAAAIEQAAGRQVQRVREHLDGPQAAEGAKLLQEIATARTTLIDPAKRANYLTSLLSPTGGSVEPWWQDPNKKPAAKPAAKPAPVSAAKPAPATKTKPSAFQDMSVRPGVRPPKQGANLPLLLLLGGGGAVVLVAAIVTAVIIFSSGSPKTEQVKATTTEKPDTGPTKTTSPVRTNHEPENNEPTKSMFLTEADPPEAVAKPTEVKKYERHTGLVQALSLAPGGRRFLSGGEGGVIEWDLPSAKSFLRHKFNNVPATAAAYLAGSRLIACADEGSILIRDAGTNQLKNTLKYPRGLLLAMTAASDGKHLLTGGNDGTLRWWDVSVAEPEKEFEVGDSVQIYCVAVSRDGKLAAAGGKDGSLGVWDISTKKKLWHTKHHRNSVTGVAFSPDGKRLASASLDKSVAAWDSESGQSVARFPGHEPEALCVSFLEKSPALVSGGKDGLLRFWSLESGLSARSLPVPATVMCLAVGPADGFVLIGGSGGMLQVVPMPELDFEAVVKEEPPAQKMGLPGSQEIDAALSALKLKYKQELESSKPDDLTALAERLLQKSGGKAQPPQRLAFFREARDLFIKTGKLDSAFQVIDQADRWFEIDDLAEKANALPTLISATGPTGQKTIVEAAMKLLQRTEAEARPDIARQIMPALDRAAAKSGMAELTKSIAALKKQREMEAMVVARLKELQTKLKATPNDRELNLAYGLLLCSRHDWKDGLAHLAKGADAKLAELASKDIAEPKEAKKRFDLGQAWAEAAEKATDAKLICFQRAKHWIEQAEPGLFGDDKPKATVLLGQVSAKIGALGPKDTIVGASPDKPPRKTSEPVIRRNFNTLRNEATYKSQWKVEGSSRWENIGLRLLENPVSMQSTFQLIDNWKMEIVVDYDNRDLIIEVNKQTITLKPTRNEPAIYLERKGKKLSYALADLRGLPVVKTISLPDDALEPSVISIKLEGAPSPSRKEGMLIPRIVVVGPCKVEE